MGEVGDATSLPPQSQGRGELLKWEQKHCGGLLSWEISKPYTTLPPTTTVPTTQTILHLLTCDHEITFINYKVQNM